MTKKSQNGLEQTCIKSINEICECRKICRQVALRFVCRVTMLARKRKISDSDSIDKLLKSLFAKAGKKLSPDLKTRYRQAVLYLHLKKIRGSEQEMLEQCNALKMNSYRKLADTFANQSRKVPPATSGKSAKAKRVSRACKSSANLKKVSKMARKPMADSFKQVKELIKKVSKTRTKEACLVKNWKLKIIVVPV